MSQEQTTTSSSSTPTPTDQDNRSLSNYDKFIKDFKYRKTIFNQSLMDVLTFFVNLIIFPAIGFQMYKTWRIKETKDFNPLFLLLQLLGGVPEGILGVIIGYLKDNPQMMAIGIYAAMYNVYMLFFRFFGRKGILESKGYGLFSKKTRKL